MFVHTQHPDTVQAVGILNEQPPASGQHRVVGSMPRHAQVLRHPGNRESVNDHRFQRPQRGRMRQLGFWSHHTGGVLLPHTSTVITPIPTQPEVQLGWPPPHGHVGDPPDHTASHPGLGATVATEIVAVYDATFQRSLLGAEVLTGHRHPIVVQHAKRIEIWAREGRLGHVEVFLQMCSFSTSIIERPRHFLCLQHTPATKPIYTQNSEEPDKARETGIHHTAFEFDTFDMWLNDYIRLRDRDIRPFLMLDHGITMSVYYQDPDGNGVEIQVDGFGDWADSSEWIATSLEFARNPIGEWFDPE